MANREALRTVVGLGLFVLTAGSVAAQSAARRDAPVLRRVERRVVAELPRADGEAPLRSASGERIGTWILGPDGAHLRPQGQREVVGPPLQLWVASSDGRTLAGAGQPGAPEHPFALEVAVLRDGQQVAALGEELGTESAITVSDDGHVAIAGHRAGERGRPFALLLRPDGTPLFRTALPEGTLARDPVLFGERLLVRVHDVLDASPKSGAVLAVDALGVHTLLGDEGVQSLVGFPDVGRALAVTSTELVYVDALDGHVLWRSTRTVRPAGPHAWTLSRSGPNTALAVVAANVQRNGAAATPPSLVLLDEANGSQLDRAQLDAAAPLGDVAVRGEAHRLVVDWNGAQEVFAW